MRKNLIHTETGPMTFEVDLAAGIVEVTVERGRERAEFVLEPLRESDETAADLISRSRHTSRGEVFSLRVPRPEPTSLAGSAVTMVNGGTAVVSSGSITVVNGRIVAGNGAVHQVTGDGAVRVTARLPQGSSVRASTVSADVASTKVLRSMTFETTSGDLRVESAERVRASTISGDVRIGRAHSVRVNTTSGDLRAGQIAELDVRSVSGDVDVRGLFGTTAEVVSTSGDVDIRVERDATVRARTVSGDIDITAEPDVTVQTETRSVSGRVRTPRR